MCTERKLRQPPAVIQAFRGLPAAAFWELIEKIKEQALAAAQFLEKIGFQALPALKGNDWIIPKYAGVLEHCVTNAYARTSNNCDLLLK